MESSGGAALRRKENRPSKGRMPNMECDMRISSDLMIFKREREFGKRMGAGQFFKWSAPTHVYVSLLLTVGF